MEQRIKIGAAEFHMVAENLTEDEAAKIAEAVKPIQEPASAKIREFLDGIKERHGYPAAEMAQSLMNMAEANKEAMRVLTMVSRQSMSYEDFVSHVFPVITNVGECYLDMLLSFTGMIAYKNMTEAEIDAVHDKDEFRAFMNKLVETIKVSITSAVECKRAANRALALARGLPVDDGPPTDIDIGNATFVPGNNTLN